MFKSFLLLFLCCSCAKVSYLWNQGMGQLEIQRNSIENEKVLVDAKVKEQDKEKIRQILNFKSFFYEYFSKKTTEIYSETTYLGRDAVTYLVIASPFQKVEAKKECFWFVGCFPYLGFFNQEDAFEHEKELKSEGYETYVRPVYAYSSLGYFEDRILSSFFVFDQFTLAELIFHELFHTIFFVKDEVDLNEALASFFASELLKEYFQASESELTSFYKDEQKDNKLRELMVRYTKELNNLYESSKVANHDQAKSLRKELFDSQYRSRFKKVCSDSRKCFPLERSWNNASLAAYLTYENEQQKIQDLKDVHHFDLKGLLNYLEEQYRLYKKERPKQGFADFLFAKKEN